MVYRHSAKRPKTPYSDAGLQEIATDTGLEGSVGGITLKRYLLYRALEKAPRKADLKRSIHSPVFYGMGGAAVLGGVDAAEQYLREDIPQLYIPGTPSL